MNFANPAALAFAALAIPIVIFYILKIRLRRVPVSTVVFWQQIFEEKQPRSIWQHLRHLLSLLLQLLLLSLLVLALAEPFFNWEILQARRIVLVLDNSASMNANDVEPSRLAAAKTRARDVIVRMRFRDQMAIIAAGTEPHVVCGMSGHEKTLLGALDRLPATDGPTRVGAAVALGRRLVGTEKNGEIVVASDACFEGAKELAAEKDVRLLTVGTRVGNVGITRFQVRRSLLDPTGYQILAEVVNADEDSVDCRLELDLDGEVVDVVPLQLEPGDTWSQTFDKTSTAGGRLTARLSHRDALVSDNEAWALLPKRELQPVLLVSEPNLFLEKVLEANPLVQLKTAREIPPEMAPGTVLILHRTVPEKLPSGPVLVVDPDGSCDLWELGETLDNPIVTKQDPDSLLMSHVRLDNVLMPRARRLTYRTHARVLAGAVTGDPLYAAVERPDGKVLVLTVNLEQGDLPLRTAFPILVTNALGWFAGAAGELKESLATGATTEVTWAAPPGGTAHASDIRLWPPEGPPRPLPPDVTKATVGPLDLCGVWTIAPAVADRSPPRPAETPLLELACNLANRGESDLRPPEELLVPSSEERLVAGFLTRPIWYYLVVLAWLLAGAEWYLYQRRWIS